jgi:hypothetical protein
MTEYQKGRRVRVEFEGVISAEGNTGLMVIADEDNPCHLGVGWVPKSAVTVLDPPDWPPQQGDIWEITQGSLKGYEFFARRNSAGEIILSPQDGGSAWTPDVLKGYDPVLVRRREKRG